MSRSTSRLLIELAARGLTFADLASAIGYSVGTLYNLASGTNRSKPARRKVEVFLGAEIWPTAALSDLARPTLLPTTAVPGACRQAAAALPPQSAPEPTAHTAGPVRVTE